MLNPSWWPPAPTKSGVDITQLKKPGQICPFYLYVMLDIFSRFVVGWLLAEQESEILAQQLIATACHNQGIPPRQLTLHR
ncbi:MAG: hypothetical protein H6633_09275 [Anaerolineales bacterium]|nr:hypothetical protein [Anaerolineales bacterium]